MEQDMKDFLNCIDNEMKLYRKILSLVEEEKKILVRNEELQLEETVKIQEQLISSIDEEEKERIRLLAKLTEEEKKSVGVKDRIKKMKSLILKISEINNTNVFLIEQGRKNIRAFLELILKKNNPGSYLSNGKPGIGTEGNIFIDKTI